MISYFCTRHPNEELISLMQLLLVKVPLAAPSRTRKALSVEDERKVIMGTWKQARDSVLTNSFQGPGRRLQVLQCLAAHILINRLHRIVACAELSSEILLSTSAVFFSGSSPT